MGTGAAHLYALLGFEGVVDQTLLAMNSFYKSLLLTREKGQGGGGGALGEGAGCDGCGGAA